MTEYEVVNGVAVITCMHPPVNQLSYRLRVGLFDGLKKATADDSVKSIVIIGGGRTFPAGADIAEFANGMGFKLPITDFIPKCEMSPKPVVAAIHGTALGGGLEVALGCHYRIGTSRCRVGFPEVLIGLLPGAGGTQRLPRLIGPMLAAEIIVSGQHVRAARAHKIGILDKVIHIEPNHRISVEQLVLRTAAIKFAQSIAGTPFEDRRISLRTAEPLNDFFYDMMKQQSAKKARGFLAPALNLEAVRASHAEPSFAKGLKKERSLFMKLATDSQSRSLQHIFFAQRQIAKVPGINPKSALPIKKVGIVGCGTMGGGILMNFVQAGIPVIVLEMKQQYLEKGMGVIRSNWERQLKRGKISKQKLEKYMSLITGTLDYNDFSDVDIVIEAVFENTDIKKKVFRRLDEVTKPTCILASNTSFLDIGDIAKVTSRPSKCVGTHFFAPANQMQLLENVRTDQTDSVTIATVQKMAKTIKKKGVLVKVCPGFVGNRMFAIEGTEANRLLEEGAYPEQVDKILYDFGWAMGIFAVSDLSGNDIGYRRRDEMGYIKDPSKRPIPDYYPFTVPDTLVEMGRLGLKVGKGFYNYKGRSRKPIPNPGTRKLIEEVSRKKGIVRREISKEEIIERCMYTMVNEGFKILEEGVALRPSDIDVVFVFGYGFPAYRGGPMFWADLIGLKKVRKGLLKYAQKYPMVDYFQPANLLNECVEKKMSLAKFWKKKEKAAQKARAKL